MQRRHHPLPVLLLMACFALSSLPAGAQAAVIGTQQYLSALDRQKTIERIDATLARAEVQQQLNRLGVDPAEAMARVNALTQEELELLAANLEELPAGAGLLGLVGAVFVVLLILELVGVIDIFKRI